MQHRACLAITGAIWEASRENLPRARVRTLQSRPWYRKLAMFYKIYRNKSSFYLFNLIPEKTSSHATRNVDCITLIKTKHNFFKNTFFPSLIMERNWLDPAIRNAEIWVFLKAISSNLLDPPQ